MKELGKAFIEFREKYWSVCESVETCEKCPLKQSAKAGCSLGELTEEEIAFIETWTPPITTKTPKDTKIKVRNYDNETWLEAYLCAKLQKSVIVFVKEDGDKYTFCKSDEANGVRRFYECICC